MAVAFIGLGSNLGDRHAAITGALSEMAKLPGSHLGTVSKIIETDPVGPIHDQPRFLNAVATLDTSLAPLELLDGLLAIEARMGRRRDERWGPRIIDLDILLYDRVTLDHPRLRIPHPEIANRPFVVESLKELHAL